MLSVKTMKETHSINFFKNPMIFFNKYEINYNFNNKYELIKNLIIDMTSCKSHCCISPNTSVGLMASSETIGEVR
jgi:hypothetical protein